VRTLYEGLTPEDVRRLGEFYTTAAYFRDPFNEVRGLAAIQRIFDHMFENLDDVRFVFRDEVVDGGGAFVSWDMGFRVRRWKAGGRIEVHGASHLRFAPDGRVSYHRDYWDTGEELYARLPAIGPVIRYLRRRLA
jgi:ketosteroid isomerase-like protein